MSYPVRVVVKESISDVVRTGDQLRLPLCDDPVLRKPAADRILREKLSAGGWTGDEQDGDVYRKTLESGAELIWNLKDQELTLIAESESCVDHEVELTLRGDSYTREGRSAQEQELRERGEEEVKRKLENELAEVKGEREGELLKEVQEKLEQSIGQAREEVNQVLEGVYRDWLIEQAGSLGQVVGQHESESDDGKVYELTIKIEE